MCTVDFSITKKLVGDFKNSAFLSDWTYRL